MLGSAPARAIETINLRRPLLDTDFSIRVAELRSPEALIAGDSDLAELDRATRGEIGRRLKAVVNSNLPFEAKAVIRQAQGSPLLDQVLLLVGALGDIDGLPDPLDPAQFEQAMERSAAKGGITLLDVIEQLPGQSVTVELGRLGFSIQRFRDQRRSAEKLIASIPAVGSAGPLQEAGRQSVARQELKIVVGHRPEPLALVVLEPTGSGAAPNRLVVSQQRAMLAGKQPPPSPSELALRPKDVSAVIDAAAQGRLALRRPVNTQAVLVAGHSWGATTALQLAGARPITTKLQQLCDEVRDPSRNLSWILQCNFVGSADSAALVDPRVAAAIAVSPPMRLLFDVDSAGSMKAKVLVVSGSRDWVVPPGPEAIEPMARATRGGASGHSLVLAENADHFNLRSPRGESGGALRALLLAWFNSAARLSPGNPPELPLAGWGSATHPLRDVTSALPNPPPKPQAQP